METTFLIDIRVSAEPRAWYSENSHILPLPADRNIDQLGKDFMASVGLKFADDNVDSLPLGLAPSAKLQKCVLLIEDSEESMWLVEYALQEYGNGRYRMIWANSLSRGLDELSRGQIDVVLLDLGLPESSGPASYAWIRELTPEVPVVVLTADSREETEFEVTASGVDAYLVKDQISGSLLVHTIRTALFESRKKSRPSFTLNRLFQSRFR